jgi:hypothetical protein
VLDFPVLIHTPQTFTMQGTPEAPGINTRAMRRLQELILERRHVQLKA